MQHLHKPLIALFLAAVFISLIVMLTPTEPARALPPRPNTPTPTALAISTPKETPKETHDADWLTGAYIRLRAGAAGGAPLWTVVQWQDKAGNWRDVEGWRGYTQSGEKKWWVAPKDFGKGTFRWAVYADEKETVLLGASAPFSLPLAAGQEMTVSVNSEE